MADISKTKLKAIKKGYGEKSVAELARELNLPEKQVRKELKELGLVDKSASGRGEKTAAARIHSTRWTLAMAALAILSTFICFGASVRFPMVFDDHHSIDVNNYIRDTSNIGEFFIDPQMFSSEAQRRMYRPLVLLSYTINYAIGGDSTLSYHILNLMLHALNGLLIFLTLEVVFRSRPAAMLLAEVFLVHPAITEPVVYLSARSTLMAGTFAFAMTYAFLRHSGAERGFRWIVAAAAFFVLGLLSKENVFMVPAILIVGEYYLGTRPGDFFRERRWMFHAPLWAISIVYLLFRKYGLKLSTIVVSRPHDRSLETQILTQAGVWFEYLKKILWPIGLNNQSAVMPATGFWIDGRAFFSQPAVWLALWAVICVLVFLARRNKLFIWGVSFAAIVLIPETITALNQLSNERRIYLPLFGILTAAGSLYMGIRKWPMRWVFEIAMIIVLLMAPMSIRRTQAWRNEKALWFDSIRKAPRSEISWHGLGFIYGQEDKFTKALWALRRALAIDPKYAPSMRLMGGILLTLNKPGEALPYLRKSVELERLSHKGWYNLGVAQSQLGMLDQAVKSFEYSIELNRYYAMPHFALARIYLGQGRLDDAMREANEAVRLDGNNQRYLNFQQGLIRQLPELRRQNQSAPGPGAEQTPPDGGEQP